jgi:hypothetical protein
MRTLFDDIPAAAAADPESSHRAAARHTQSGARSRHCDMVLALVRALPGSTSVELWHQQASQARLERHEVSRRLSDLLRAGLVRQGPPRECRVRAARMVTWEAV